MEDNDDDSKMADLLSCFQQQLTFQESVLKLCQPELESNQTHISGMSSWWLELREAHFHFRFMFSKLTGPDNLPDNCSSSKYVGRAGYNYCLHILISFSKLK